MDGNFSDRVNREFSLFFKALLRKRFEIAGFFSGIKLLFFIDLHIEEKYLSNGHRGIRIGLSEFSIEKESAIVFRIPENFHKLLCFRLPISYLIEPEYLLKEWIFSFISVSHSPSDESYSAFLLDIRTCSERNFFFYLSRFIYDILKFFFTFSRGAFMGK